MPEEKPIQTPPEPAAPAAPEPEKKTDAELLAVLREVLGDEVTPENLKVTLASLKTQAEAAGALSEKVKALECAEAARQKREEAEHRNRVIAEGFRRGVLTPAKLKTPYIQNMTAAELADYCDSLQDGIFAPVGVLELSDLEPRPVASDLAGLSDVQKAIRESTNNARTIRR